MAMTMTMADDYDYGDGYDDDYDDDYGDDWH